MQMLWLVSVGNTDIPLHHGASGRVRPYELALRSQDAGPRMPSPCGGFMAVYGIPRDEARQNSSSIVAPFRQGPWRRPRVASKI